MATLAALPSLPFPPPLALTERYRPARMADFAGLEKAKRQLTAFSARPYESGWLFVGDSGTGKTSAGLALAQAIRAELHHIPSQHCTLDTIARVRRTCQYVPAAGYRFHLILVDEADRMSDGAQVALLSMLDGTDAPPSTVLVFTANGTDRLEARFLSRLRRMDFSNYGIQKDASALLERVWDAEAPQGAARPNFARLVKEANGNVRAALMELETELLCCL